MTRVYFVRHAQPEHEWEEDRTISGAAISSRMGIPLNLSVTFESALRTGEVSLF